MAYRSNAATTLQLFVTGLLLLFLRAAASAQSQPPLLIQAIPTGQRPLGADSTGLAAFRGTIWTAVANSGDNSVSIFQIKLDPSDPNLAVIASSTVIPGIPSPYAVACSGSVVTSPSSNSISIIDPTKGILVRTVQVGRQPYSAGCSFRYLVSNCGDNSLSAVDPNSFTVTTIPNVPCSRGFHGIEVIDNRTAWVAGTDANVVTLIDLVSLTVLTRIPVRGPTAVKYNLASQLVFVASSLDNSILGFSPGGLTLTSTIPGVPTPQDFFESGGLGQFASTGPANAVARITGTDVTLLPGIPGAAGLSGGSFANSNPLRPNLANFVVATSPDSNRLFLIQAQPVIPIPSQFGVGGASFGGVGVAPGALASAFASTGVSQNFSASSVPLPKTLGGVTLRFGGTVTFDAAAGRWNYSAVGSLEAPLLFVGPNQINFQLPPGISLGDSVPAQLTKPDGSTLLTTLRITATAPGIFTVLMNGQGQAAVINQDNSPNFGTNPARRGSFIQIYATGAGDTDPPLLPGEPAPASGNPLVLTRTQPTVTIGGQTARVLFSGMAPSFVGLWQINAEVPSTVTPGPAVSVTITAGGVTSNTVTIAVE